MLLAVSVLLFVYFMKTNSLSDYSQASAFCNVGDKVYNRCISCVCTSKHIYDCTPKKCSGNITTNNILDDKTSRCAPNKIYVHNTTTCICNNKGDWPHKRCSEIFGILRSNISKRICEPNSYVTVDCNICRCNAKGKIDRDRCTRNICQTKLPINFRKSLNIHGTCKPKSWYSIAPCQICYCINENKLICNNDNYNTQNLVIGKHKLSVCKGDIFKEAKQLLQEDQHILRDGEMNNNIKSLKQTTQEVTTTQQYLNIYDNSDLLVNIQNNDKETDIAQNPNMIDQEEGSTESEEGKQKNIIKISREGAFTQIPYQDYEDNSNENRFENDFKEDRYDKSDNEIGLDTKEFYSKKSEDDSAESKEKVKVTSQDSGQKLGRSIKNNIPDIFNKVLKPVLRKSMVSLKVDYKCTPGSANLVNCNVCYCLKNGKLLCTENKCE